MTREDKAMQMYDKITDAMNGASRNDCMKALSGALSTVIYDCFYPRARAAALDKVVRFVERALVDLDREEGRTLQ
jgi:hypothetical protein